MAVIRVPFCATAELCPSFVFEQDFSEPNGVKSVMFDTGKLQVVSKQEKIDVPDIGLVEMCIYHVVGSIPYICAAYPVTGNEAVFHVQQRMATFNNTAGNTSVECAGTTASDAFGWVSAAGCVYVDVPIGGACGISPMPGIEGVTVENFAAANTLTSSLEPTCPNVFEPCGEEPKCIVKWRGCFVITTTTEEEA